MGHCRFGPGCGVAGLEHDDGLLLCHSLGDLEESLSVLEALYVAQDDLSLRILDQIGEVILAMQVGLVAATHKAATTEATFHHPPDYGGRHVSALSHHCHWPRWREHRWHKWVQLR